MLRKNSSDIKGEILITEGRLDTEDFKQIQFTGSELLQSQELQKDEPINIQSKIVISDIVSLSKRNDQAGDIQRFKKSGKDSLISDSKIVNTLHKNTFNSKAQTKQFNSSNPQLQHMNQYNFVTKTRKISINQFSFWSVVQIRKVIENLKKKYAYANLTGLQYDLIGDKSVVKKKKESFKERYGYQSQNMFAKVFSKCLNQRYFYRIKKRFQVCWQSLADMIPIFNPSNPLKLFWDFLISLSLLLFFFITPLHIAVSIEMTNLLSSTLLYIALALIVVDIFVTINTGFFSKGHIVTNRDMILKYYLRNQLKGDIIAIFPFFFTLPREEYSFIPSIFTLLIFIKVRDFSKILKKIEDQFLLKPTTTNLVELLKLLFILLFVAHLGACVWIFQAQQSTQQYKWYNGDKLDDNWDPKWLDLYVKAYYYNTVTMVTVGYGDIYPANNYERLLSIGTILVACCIFAYIVNSIGNIFKDFFRHSKAVSDNFYAINNYMEKKNISSSLRSKIREYLDYYWDEERDNLAEKEQKIIQQLSDSLKKDLKIEANKIVLKDAPIFHENFSKFFNEKICGMIQEQRIHPEQIITREDEQDDCSIYFIQKGKVEVFIKNVSPDGVQSTKTIMVLEKGQYFGTFGFFTGLKRKQSIRSMEFCQFLVIKRSDFIEALKQFSDDYEKFCMIKDQLQFNSQNSVIEQNCFSCNKKDHIFQDCPSIHYAPDQQQIIKKFNLTSTHHLRKKTKRSFMRYHTRKELEQTIRQGIKYLEQNESFLLEQDWIESAEESSQSDITEESTEKDEDSREEFKRVSSKSNFLSFQNAVSTFGNTNQKQQSRNFEIKSFNHLENENNQNPIRQQSNEQDMKRIEQIDEVQSTLFYQDQNSHDQQSRRKLDDFNINNQVSSPTSKIGSSGRKDIFSDYKNAQQTQKIKLNPNQTLTQDNDKNEVTQEKNIFNFMQNNFLKNKDYDNLDSKQSSKNFFDNSHGQKLMFNSDKSNSNNQEKINNSRGNYFNMKVNVKPFSIMDIQTSQKNERVASKSPLSTKLQTNSIRKELFEVVLNESAGSQKSSQKEKVTIKRVTSQMSDDNQDASDDRKTSQYQNESTKQNNGVQEQSISDSLPKLELIYDERRDSKVLNAFQLQRFDDTEGLASQKYSPHFLSRKTPINFDNYTEEYDIQAQTYRINEQNTERKLLQSNKTQNNGMQQNNGNIYQTNSQKSINNQQQSNNMQHPNLNGFHTPNNESTMKTPLTQYSPISSNNKELINELDKQFDLSQKLRIPLERLSSNDMEESTKQANLLRKTSSYRKIPLRRRSVQQFTNQTSIELVHQLSNGMKKSRLSQMGITKRQLSNLTQQGSSNLMYISNATSNHGSRQFTVNQQPLMDSNNLFKQRKSVLSTLSVQNTGQQSKDKVSPTIDKALKKEKFWKNMLKNGVNMAQNNEISSPFMMRAKLKLEERNEGSGSNSCKNYLSKFYNKSSNQQSTFANTGLIGLKPASVGMDESLKSISNKKLNKKDGSPQTSIQRIERKKRTLIMDTNQKIGSQDIQGIESLKQMIQNMMNKFEDIKQNQNQQGINQKYVKNSIFSEQQRFQHQEQIEENNRYNQQGYYTVGPSQMTSNQLTPIVKQSQQIPISYTRRMSIVKQNHDEFFAANQINDYLQYNPTQDLLLDVLKNFTRYFPQYNISSIQVILNKKSKEKLKKIKKNKLKKAKATQLMNSLEYNKEQLNFGSQSLQFKHKQMSSKFVSKSLHTKQEQSEDDVISEKSRSISDSNTKRISYGNNENFSHAMHKLVSKPSYSLSQQSINTNNQYYMSSMVNQSSHHPNFSKFKH